MRWALAILGLGALAYGVSGWLTDDTVGIATFLVVVLVVHDFVLLPVAVVVSALVVRFAPGWARVPAQLALYVSAVISLVALPFVIGKGRLADNPSAFPQNYGRGLLVILAVVWVATAVWAVLRRRWPVA